MKNKLSKLFLILISFLILTFNLSANEQFDFNVTEIEIYEEGNLFKGLKRGTIKTNSGINLKADTFEYNKNKNILSASGNVIIKDTNNDITIETESVVYFKDKEIIITKSRSKAFGKKTIINANTFEYYKKNDQLNAIGKVEIQDLVNDIFIETKKASYFNNENLIITDGDSKATEKNTIINANSFRFDKKLNILNATGKVKIDDKINNFLILSNEINYYRNKEEFISKQQSEAISENLNINAKEFEFNKNLNIINAYKDVIINDKINKLIIFRNINYFKNKEKLLVKAKLI